MREQKQHSMCLSAKHSKYETMKKTREEEEEEAKNIVNDA